MKALVLTIIGLFALNTALIADEGAPAATNEAPAAAPADAVKKDEHGSHEKKAMKKKSKKKTEKTEETKQEGM